MFVVISFGVVESEGNNVSQPIKITLFLEVIHFLYGIPVVNERQLIGYIQAIIIQNSRPPPYVWLKVNLPFNKWQRKLVGGVRAGGGGA